MSALLLISSSLACSPTSQGVESKSEATPPPAPQITLHAAAVRGDLPAVHQHIAAGTHLDEKDQYGSTPLTIAVTFGKIDVAKALIAAGANLEIPNNEGTSPLELAAFFAHPEIARALLDQGANKYARSATGASAYDIAQSPLEVDRALFDQIGAALSPLGLRLDYARIQAERPKIAAMLAPTPEQLRQVSYAPKPGGDWEIATPAQRGLDSALVAELYLDAGHAETLFSLLVVKDGYLVAEGYFNGSSTDRKELIQSVTKSFTSASVGLALEQGCLSSLDQKVVEFFPAQADQLTDPRKREITVRQLLQMRGGFPWEETDPKLWQALIDGDLIKPLVDFPLVNDPGTAFNYSNLSSHWLGLIVARACKTDLKSFSEANVLSALNAKVGEWKRDRNGDYVGLAEMRLTARDLAKFGKLYLDGGQFGGERVLPAEWVSESLQKYSTDAWVAQPPQHHVGRYFRDLGYGYQWWSAQVDGREFDFAWGHGGQLIVLLPAVNMVVVTTSNPFYGQHDDTAWMHEQAIFNVVGKFIKSLPQQ